MIPEVDSFPPQKNYSSPFSIHKAKILLNFLFSLYEGVLLQWRDSGMASPNLHLGGVLLKKIRLLI